MISVLIILEWHHLLKLLSRQTSEYERGSEKLRFGIYARDARSLKCKLELALGFVCLQKVSCRCYMRAAYNNNAEQTFQMNFHNITVARSVFSFLSLPRYAGCSDNNKFI